MDLGITALDTSFNYRGFTSHAMLAAVVGDLLPRFTVSTKVGYFPMPGAAEHSLAPARLRAALEQTNRDLGRPPDVAFLHNPEASLQEPSDRPTQLLAGACAALAEATAAGLCEAWGISSWNPRALVGLTGSTDPAPAVLMVRAGLLVGSDVLDAAETVASQWGLPPQARWGMSPFGGNTTDPVWSAFDPRLFLKGDADLSRAQAAFRASFLLPQVASVAVGADDPEHLRQLVNCLDHAVDEELLEQYRQLLRTRSGPHVV
ncbi:pyridoxine 4-dehydrogenase [Kitasatospora sp. MAA19]|uniref:aldo/keto reductase n=1 Tax=Kitasatospora sp. MAA19 TaxID=3035090 RepID=UPI0024766D29|nr:aldo/keto reductase [Kitasatospora sp. MAA19]MDH6704132.1 pyridoxine 4-dehydrogenase [Kitasatospora sp. MAA19]